MDFVELRAAVKAFAERLDHRFLNDLAPFDRLNPSAENLAKYFCEGLEPKLGAQGLRVESVTVWETDNTSATFRPSVPAR
jgi:6-pyruvoyltetrahydropterin/6-carboxytetrahydropterin synthase